MSIQLTGFNDLLFKVLQANEINPGNKNAPYRLMKPLGTPSGWTFSHLQYDLNRGPKERVGPSEVDTAVKLFTDILLQAKDTLGNYIVHDDDPGTERGTAANILDSKVKELVAKVHHSTSAGALTPSELDLVNLALDSSQGRDLIDASIPYALEVRTKYADKFIALATNQADKDFLAGANGQSPIGRLWLCDLRNQGTLGQITQFIQIGSAYGYTKQGSLGVDDILNVYFRQRTQVLGIGREGYDSTGNFVTVKPWDPLRRFANIVNIAGGYTPADLDEAKGVLRAYTYWYVRYEDRFSTDGRLSGVDVFRFAVCQPADNLILADVSEKYGVTIQTPGGEYDDVLMGDDKANVSDRGEYQLNGRDGNDVLLGEGGADTLDGGAGDDYLIGGSDNDTLVGGAGLDTYVFKADEGKDTIADSDGIGRIVVAGQELSGASYAKHSLDGRKQAWESEDGTLTYVFEPGGKGATTGTLTITGASLGAGQISLTDFDLAKAQDGVLGIQLGQQSALELLTSGSNPFAQAGHQAQNGLTGLTEGQGKTVKCYLNAPARAGDTLRLCLTGSELSRFACCTGEETISFAQGEITLALQEGQTEIAFAFLNTGDVDSDATLQLTATFQPAQGEAASNTLTIHLDATDEAPDTLPQPGTTINGDQRPALDEFGNVRYDAWGNVVPDGPEPGRADTLHDTPESDLILAGDGNDEVWKLRGGDDIVELGAGDDDLYTSTGAGGRVIARGGAGRDYLGAGSARDVLEGGPDGDGLYGSAQGDQIYGDEAGAAAGFIAQGATQPGNGQQGEWVDAEGGDDQVFTGAGNDLIAGGDGNDLLVSGGGNDWIWGDWNSWSDAGAYWRSWTVTETITIDANGARTYHHDVTAITTESDDGSGNDVVYAGAGDDVVFGERGDDMLYLEAGNDEGWGGEGNDVILGGEGNDLLDGGDASDAAGQDFLDGGAGDDRIEGGGGADTLFGGTGNDILSGDDADANDGADYLDGEDGNDQLYGGGGNDTLYGGGGQDELYGEGGTTLAALIGNDYLDGEDGNDFLDGSGGDDTLFGGAGNDELYGDDGATPEDKMGNDYLDGEAGDDLLIGAGGADALHGGSGNDVLYGDSSDTPEGAQADDFLDGGADDDTLDGGGGADTLYGGEGNDALYGDDQLTPVAKLGDDYLDGGAGNDILVGAGGNDILYGDDGADELHGDSSDTPLSAQGADLLDGGAGNDLLSGYAGADVLFGGEGDDILYGGEGDDVLIGGAGTDLLVGGSGSDTLDGGEGDDIYTVVLGSGVKHVEDAHGANTLVLQGGITLVLQGGITLGSIQLSLDAFKITTGQAGDAIYLDGADYDDLLATSPISTIQFSDGQTLSIAQVVAALGIEVPGSAEPDTIYGSSGRDNIDALAGDDIVSAGAGDDRIALGAGDDLLDAGEGNDQASGEDGNDVLYGGLGNDAMSGGAGQDSLDGEAGDDQIYGNEGDDVLAGGSGQDYLAGGAGNDLYDFDAGAGQDLIDDAEGANIVRFGPGVTPEDLSFRQSIAGDGSRNIDIQFGTDVLSIRGGEAGYIGEYRFADGRVLTHAQVLERLFDLTLTGSAGDDVIAGGAGADTLLGMGGNDTIFGYASNDRLDGGAGNDVLYGGEGDDTYVFGRAGGADQIYNDDGSGAGLDAIEFAADTLPGDLTITRSGEDLVLQYAPSDVPGASASALTVRNYFLQGGLGVSGIEEIRFAEGTVWRPADLRAAVNPATAGADRLTGFETDDTLAGLDGADQISGRGGHDLLDGGPGDDTLFGGNGQDTLDGGSGNDLLNGDQGADVLYGGAGNDQLYGAEAWTDEVGNDLLWGGSGNDQMRGGDGNDVYLFGRGDGLDRIVESSPTSSSARTDTVRLGAGVLPENVSWYRTNGVLDLTLVIDGSANTQLTISTQCYTDTQTDYQIERFEFDGGAGPVLSWSQIMPLVDLGSYDAMTGTAGDDVFVVDYPYDSITEAAGGGIDTVLASRSYTLPANVENLTLTGVLSSTATGNTLNNVLRGNDSDNVLISGGGTDTAYGGLGDDVYRDDDASGARIIAIENPDEGIDTVISTRGGQIPDNIETYTLSSLSEAPVTVTGNALDNVIVGKTRNYYYTDSEGNITQIETLDGGAGADTLIGYGNVRFIVDNPGDRVELKTSNPAAPAYAEVRSSVSFALPEGVRNLYLTGDQPVSGAGNRYDNVVDGSTNTAANALSAGLGNDLYVLGSGDTVDEAADAGTDVVQFNYANPTKTYMVDELLYPNIEEFALSALYGAGATLIGDDRPNVLRIAMYSQYATTGATLRGGGADDQLAGGFGSDTLDGGAGADRMSASAGSDTYVVDDAGDEVIESAQVWTGSTYISGGSDTVLASVDYVLPAEVEYLTLTGSAAIRGSGNGKANRLDGSQNAAANILAGGAGNDAYVLGAGDVAVEAAGEGIDTVESAASIVLADNIEEGRLTGSAAADLSGNAQNNTLTGNAGNNTILGGAGNDTIRASAGSDFVDPGSGNDTVATSYAYTPTTLVVSSADAQAGKQDVVSFAYSSTQVSLSRSGDDLVFVAEGGYLQVRIQRYFASTEATLIERFSFGDGVNWTAADIAARFITGTEGDDLLNGTSAAETIVALGGNDTVNAGAGNDTVDGGAGNDTLDGGADADRLTGGTGDDLFVFDHSSDAALEAPGEGTDTVQSTITVGYLPDNVERLILLGGGAINGWGNSLDNTIIGNGSANDIGGGAGNDYLDGAGGNDRLYGGAGNDSLVGGAGTDQLYGYDGNDLYIVDATGDVIVENPGEGFDSVEASVSYTLSAEVENLSLTGALAINATGNALDNILTGNAANNTLDGKAGNDTLRGGAGNDTYVVDSAGDSVIESPGEGTDLVQAGISYLLPSDVENLTLTGSAALNGTGNALANTLQGNSAANILDGGAGADTLRGGAGNDTYVIDNAGEVVSENAAEGTDLVQSSISYTLGSNLENLTLTGSAALNATGNTLANVLTGNAGANTLDGKSGADTLIGAAGDDIYVVDNSADVVTEAANEGVDRIDSSVTYTLPNNVEKLTLTGSGAINATGNALANVLTGNSATNTLAGGAGDDTYVIGTGDTVSEAANAGTDTVQAGITHTLAANVEYLVLTGSSAINGTGNTANNLLRGNSANNTLNGSSGTDVLEGLGGNDTLNDTAGGNYYSGGAGTDTLTGGSAGDFLMGGVGNDTLTTGSGADVIAFNRGDGADTVNASTGQDNTVSLGGGIRYADLAFRKSGTDLILDLGAAESLTFKSWYATSPNNKSVLTLQMVAEAMADFAPGAGDALRDHKIERFNFAGLVGAFDAALAANPTLTNWALANALAGFHLSGSDTEALGGDLAYYYGRGLLPGINVAVAQEVVGAAQFGGQTQSLRPLAGLQGGVATLS